MLQCYALVGALVGLVGVLLCLNVVFCDEILKWSTFSLAICQFWHCRCLCPNKPSFEPDNSCSQVKLVYLLSHLTFSALFDDWFSEVTYLSGADSCGARQLESDNSSPQTTLSSSSSLHKSVSLYLPDSVNFIQCPVLHHLRCSFALLLSFCTHVCYLGWSTSPVKPLILIWWFLTPSGIMEPFFGSNEDNGMV